MADRRFVSKQNREEECGPAVQVEEIQDSELPVRRCSFCSQMEQSRSSLLRVDLCAGLGVVHRTRGPAVGAGPLAMGLPSAATSCGPSLLPVAGRLTQPPYVSGREGQKPLQGGGLIG